MNDNPQIYDNSEEFLQNKFNSFVANEIIMRNQNAKPFDMFSYESIILDKIEFFNKECESILNSDDNAMKFNFLRSLRKSILLKKKSRKGPILKFTQRFDIVDNFIEILITALRGTNLIINVEILRIFSRMSRAYYRFLNPQNSKKFYESIEPIFGNENQVVKHFALISIGKIIRQSEEWAKQLFPIYEPVFKGIQLDFSYQAYYMKLNKSFYEALCAYIPEDALKTINYNISWKKSDPYLFCLRGYTKKLKGTNCLTPEIIYEIMKMIFKYFYEQYIESNTGNNQVEVMDPFGVVERIKMFDDIISINYQGTFEALKNCSAMLLPFFRSILPNIFKSRFSPAIIPALKLIGSFYSNGLEYAKYFEDFQFSLILDILLFEQMINFDDDDDAKGNYIEYSIQAAQCIYHIISTMQKDGFDILFSDKNKILLVPQVRDCLKDINSIFYIAIDEKTSYIRRIAFYNLSGIMLKYYNKDVLNIDIYEFVKASLFYLEDEDYELSHSIIFSLVSLFDLLSIKSAGTEQYVNSFSENGGRDAMIKIITEVQGPLREEAVLLMDTLMRAGVQCAQLNDQ